MRTLRNLAAAFQFLTILWVPVKTGIENLRRSMVFFPLVGAVIGLITGYGYLLLHRVFPGGVSSVLTIFVYIVLTRALHLDGFMDTIDGFFSHKDRESILRILKDPGAGSFAVLGTGVWFLVLFVSQPLLRPVDHVLIHTFTRTSILLMPLLSGYPRESGTGKFFVENVSGRTLVGALVFTAAIGAVVYFMAEPQKPIRFLVYGGLLLISLAIAAFNGLWAKRKIGGITGDVLGFSIETAHTVMVLLIPVALKFFLE